MNYEKALEVAKFLKSEQGENVEYDRALVEFLADGFGISNQRAAADLDVNFQKLYFPQSKAAR